ncbi:pilus assembly protein [Acinetobacter ursingii]|uniref:pilus assembly protein n=2 Tax=Acinetobacter ursingii TaxID=108980 RepID=UPI001D18036F|nr:PilC/PilY family type IV pilus protein [Acinetobacter ursingii]
MNFKTILKIALINLFMFYAVNVGYASDLTIYQGNTTGQTSIFMMLDTSGSMGAGQTYNGSSMSIQDDYGVCVVDRNGNGGYSAVSSEDSGTSPNYKRYYCPVSSSTYNSLSATYKARVQKDCTANGTGYKCYDRLTRLKDAMFNLLGSSALSGIKLGVGYFSLDGKGQKGIISMPAKAMSDSTHVSNLKTFVAGLVATGGTPTAAAYAEAGAYMLGTTTSGVTTESVYIYKEKYVYTPGLNILGYAIGEGWRECKSWSPSDTASNPTYSISENGYYYQKCADSNLLSWVSELLAWSTTADKDINTLISNGYVVTRYTGWFDSPIYAENTQKTYQITRGTDSIYSGYSNSGKYVSGSGNYSTTTSNATYSTMTDIKTATTPSNYVSPSVANSSCSGNGIYFLTDGYPNGTDPASIRNLMNLTLTKNGTPTINMTASTCSSGLSSSGSSDKNNAAWECIGEYSKALMNKSNPRGVQIQTAVVGFGSSFANITKNTDGSYNCNAAGISKDIQNACLWGSSDYGTGGFYQASNKDDIISSMTQFLGGLQVDFKPTNLGVISIPKDPLDQTKSMGTGFFPMLQPLQDSTRVTWQGNLKKYYVYNGTLSDSLTGGDSLYTSTQEINPNAQDIWSSVSGDNSPINIGGSWNKIPVPSASTADADSISNTTSSRNVFVLSNGSMKKVTKDNLATDIAADQQVGTATEFPITTRASLLKYLGYNVTPANWNKTTLDAITYGQSPYRFLGGVIHSKPLVVTQSATINAATNAVTSRNEYVVYGSMEGGLHIVDAGTGKEQSVFIPKEIIANQSETLASTDATSANGLKYGVDAPWTVDNTFKITTQTSSSTSTTKYIANKMNIYGGMRMGGTGIYGLDISTPTSPNLLFNITPQTAGFSRLAQIWSKPTLTDIRVQGVKTRVLIFGGGYDPSVYETTNFTEPSGSTATLGNAIYIVDATTGALIWMASSNTTGVADSYKATTSSDMKYSVVGQPVVMDYDADGLSDVIYFADLGGQIFRVDLNNVNQVATTANNNVAVRVQPIAKLRADSFVPRFYERLAVAVFDDGQDRFVLVTAGSGNRSYPLIAETAKNKVYGIIDRDAATNTLSANYSAAATITPNDLVTSGVLGKTATAQTSTSDVALIKAKTKKGWTFELRSTDSGNYARAYEEPELKTGDLYVTLYDPKATPNGAVANSCTGGVRGLSTIYRICMPYGDCAAYLKTDYQGIVAPSFGSVSSDPRNQKLVTPVPETHENCIGNCPTVNTTLTEQNVYTYSQNRKIKTVRWYEW